MCGYLGFDFIIIDMEHLLFDPERFEGIVRAADMTGMTPIFRPSKNDPDLLLPYLDAGAQGVFVPHVATAEDARRVVDAVKYPPDGSRGAGSERAAQYGITTTPAEHVRASNAETLVTVSIEDLVGIQNVDEIAAVNGLDVVCMGPGDLALALGHPGDYDHPAVQEVFLGLDYPHPREREGGRHHDLEHRVRRPLLRDGHSLHLDVGEEAARRGRQPVHQRRPRPRRSVASAPEARSYGDRRRSL